MEDGYPKLIVAIIASYRDDYKLYKDEWKRVIEACRKKEYPIQFYFLHAVDKNKEIIVEEDDFIYPCHENMMPGIFKKTFGFYEWVFQQNIGFDYMIRTNLSSFYHFEYLLEDLKTQSREKYICGMLINHRYQYPTGCGAVFSRDIIRLFLDNYNDEKHRKSLCGLYDDQAVGYLMYYLKISFKNYQLPMINIKSKDKIDNMLSDKGKYHYRIKTSENVKKRIEEDVPMYRLLVDKVYYS